MIKYRDYQKDIIEKGVPILKEHHFLYLSMEVRTGKTLTAFGILERVGIKKLLFATKKKAMSSIAADYKSLNPSFEIIIINWESLHKVDLDGVDGLICDEAHSLGAFPKPSKRAKQIRSIHAKCSPKTILLTGTPTPESYSQMYHQVYGIKGNPFAAYKNFYRFADDYVTVTKKKIGHYSVNDYSQGRQDILDEMDPYTISVTQERAGFKSEIEEEIVYVKMSDYVKTLIRRLKRDRVIEGKNEVILADTGAKMMSKIHQLCSGTVKFESGNHKVIGTEKAEWIKWKFEGEKIGIFYKFVAELEALKQVFGDSITTDLQEFDECDKNIALQIASGREGISLRNAKYLVFYNIDFSATSYWQARDRMTTKDRTYNKIFWIFSEGGIEQKIYASVNKKKSYTLQHFKRNFLHL